MHGKNDAPDPHKNQLPPIFILAGGRGTRLGSLAQDKPKSMVEVAGEPFVAHQLRLLKRLGARQVIICTGYLGEMIEGYVKSGEAFGIEVRYSSDGDRLLGTGGAIKRALATFIEVKELALTYGDSYLDVSFNPAFRCFLRSQKEALMTVLHNCDRWGSSNVSLENGQVIEYVKRPTARSLEYIDYGFSFLKAAAIQKIPEQSFDLSLVWQSLIDRKELSAYEIRKRFYEIGTPEGLIETEKQIRKRTVRA